MRATGVYDPVTKVVAGGRGGNRLPPGHPARSRRPYDSVRKLPPDPVRRDRMAKEHALRAVSHAANDGELCAQEVAVLAALVSFSGSSLEPSFPGLGAIGSRAGGMAARTAGTWLASLRAKGWVVRAHRYLHYRDPHTRERSMRGTSCLWRVDVPERWLGPIQANAQQARSVPKKRAPHGAPAPGKGVATPKAPQNDRRPPGRTQQEWDAELERRQRTADAREAKETDRKARAEAERAAWERQQRRGGPSPAAGARAALRRSGAGPGP